MTPRGSSHDMVAFAVRMFELIERTRANSTYKYALLLALIDACQRGVDEHGHAPDMITTRQLAVGVLNLYWPQARPHSKTTDAAASKKSDDTAKPLQQNQGQRSVILKKITAYQDKHNLRNQSSYQARAASPEEFTRLLNEVEWRLISEPIPRLQRFNGINTPFIYDTNWTLDGVHKNKKNSGVSAYLKQHLGDPTKNTDTQTFDNRLLLLHGIGDMLVQLAPLLRSIIQNAWTRLVARLNNFEAEALQRFLFEPQRASLAPVVPALREAQGGRCFYCHKNMDAKHHVDHFIPWTRCASDDLHNLVLTHPTCNLNKRDHLAATPHLTQWRSRLEGTNGDAFGAATASLKWPRSRESTLSIARANYFLTPDQTPLWIQGKNQFEPADAEKINAALRRPS